MRNNFEQEQYENALTLLNDISGMILEKRDYQNVLNRIIEEVARSFDARAGSIAVPDEDQESFLKYVAGFNREPELLKRLNTTNRLRVNEGVAGRAYSEEKIVGVSNVFDDQLFKDRFHEHARREQFTAMFSIPLIAFGTCIGVATLYYGEERQFEDSFRTIMKPVANQIAIAMLQSDLIETLEQDKTRLRKQAETDGLTGLPNHRKIQTVLREEVRRSERYDRPIACIMVDIDHFKSVNDTYGHPFGDVVLEQLSNLFREEKRDVDTVGRYGGEEFLFVLPETTEKRAEAFAERLREAVEDRTFEDDDTSVRITVSLGIATVTGNDPDAAKLIERADTALLHAKETGRNRSVRYDEMENRTNGAPSVDEK